LGVVVPIINSSIENSSSAVKSTRYGSWCPDLFTVVFMNGRPLISSGFGFLRLVNGRAQRRHVGF
jgi:hypothetical protein